MYNNNGKSLNTNPGLSCVKFLFNSHNCTEVGMFIVSIGTFIVSVGTFIVSVGTFMVSIGTFVVSADRVPATVKCRGGIHVSLSDIRVLTINH